LNIELQAALNPAGDRKVERFGWTFALGDKAMQIENDYEKEVYDGDIGTIDDVDFMYGFGELDMLVQAGKEYTGCLADPVGDHCAFLQLEIERGAD
jgi:exodeoxyribonuclease V alpha subunit